MNVASLCNCKQTAASGFAISINAVVENCVILIYDIVDVFFVGHSIEREKSVLVALGGMRQALLHHERGVQMNVVT